MSVRGGNHARALIARYFAILPLVAVLAMSGCGDGVFSPNQNSRAQLKLQPVFSLVDWQSLSADINLIRITALQLPARSLLLRQETSVDPTAAEWQLPLDLPVNSEIEVLVELINRGAGDVIVYSGRTLIRTRGGQPAAALVPVFPGPPDNLDITSLAIGPKNQALLEGEQLQLTAQVAGTSNPTILWSSSNPDVVKVDANGFVQAVALGQATIQAVAGPKGDNVTFEVGPRAAAIQLSPSAVTLGSLNEEVTFNARVLDARNTPIDLPVTYETSNPNIALHLGNGRFRAQGSGTATITASAIQKGQTYTTSTTLKVQQQAVSLSVTGAPEFRALGEQQTLVAEARDAKGNLIPSFALTWKSLNEPIAAVDASGVVTAIGNGTAVIRVSSGALSAETQVSVQQVEFALTIAPADLTLKAGQSAQMVAAVLDARGNPMDAHVTWSVQGAAHVATVTPTGDVTGLQEGVVAVTARYNNLHASATLTVRPSAVQLIFDRPELNLMVGAAQQVRAFLADEDSTPVSGPITYTTQNPAIAIVDGNGVVTGISAGQTFIVATAQNFQARLPVIVTMPAAGDIAVFPDLNVFQESPMAPGNRQVLLNLVTFPGIGDRTNANSVWLNPPDPRNCAFCGNTFELMRSEIRNGGMNVESAAAGNGRLVGIPANVKALFLYAPNGPFTASEVSLLKAFVATGGRLILLGGHATTAVEDPSLNDLLAGLGSSLRAGTQSLGCGRTPLQASSLRAHQITAGVSEFRAGCKLELMLGPGDAALVYDETNTFPIVAVTRPGAPN